jgi:hypothetical protein
MTIEEEKDLLCAVDYIIKTLTVMTLRLDAQHNQNKDLRKEIKSLNNRLTSLCSNKI